MEEKKKRYFLGVLLKASCGAYGKREIVEYLMVQKRRLGRQGMLSFERWVHGYLCRRKDITLNDFVRDWMACISFSISPKLKNDIVWSLPQRGNLKWNFDGSAVGSLGSSGYGGILRDDEGKVCWVIAGPLDNGDSTRAEPFSLLLGLREIKSLGKCNCLVEGDSKVVISWALGISEGMWVLWHYLYEIRDLMREMGVVLSHIPRSQNGEADRLAKWGREQTAVFKGSSFPDWE